MAKISTYQTVTPAATDLVLGTDVGSSNATKNFTAQSIADLAVVSLGDLIQLSKKNSSKKKLDFIKDAFTWLYN